MHVISFRHTEVIKQLMFLLFQAIDVLRTTTGTVKLKVRPCGSQAVVIHLANIPGRLPVLYLSNTLGRVSMF